MMSSIYNVVTNSSSIVPPPNPKISFKQQHPEIKRKKEAARLMVKYPDRVAVIVEKSDKADMMDIDKKKYLVPVDLTMGQFVYVIRKRIKLPSDQAIFLFVNNKLPPAAMLMSQVRKDYADTSDNFVYVTYSNESTFGSDS
jgi:GABA(A) receptor-associated protein